MVIHKRMSGGWEGWIDWVGKTSMGVGLGWVWWHGMVWVRTYVNDGFPLILLPILSYTASGRERDVAC